MKKQIYWHVVMTKNSIRVSPRTTRECNEVKGSTSCFITRQGAINQANTKSIK